MSNRNFSLYKKQQIVNELLLSGLSTDAFAPTKGVSGRALREWRAAEVEAAFGPQAVTSATPGGKARYQTTREIVQRLTRENLVRARKVTTTYQGGSITQSIIADLTGSTKGEVSSFERGVAYYSTLAGNYAKTLGYFLFEVEKFGFIPSQSRSIDVH